MGIVVLLWAARGAAQDVEADVSPGLEIEAGPEQLDRAREQFQRGLEFVEQGLWAEAEISFRAVLAVKSSSVAAYNLASALAHQNKLVEAAELLRGVVRDDTADADTRDAAQQLLNETEPRIGSITVRVSGSAAGAQISVDERLIGATRVQSISVNPGEHVVSAHRDGVELEKRRFWVGDSHPLKAEVQLVLHEPQKRQAPAPALQPSSIDRRESPPPAAADDDDGGSTLWLWAGGGVLATAVAAVVVVVLASGGGGTEQPVEGDAGPGVFRGVVAR